MPKQRKLLRTVEDTEAAFYDALGRADVEALMALWAEEEDIICIHPGAPRLLGYASIRASWEAIFEHGAIVIRPIQLHAMQNPMMAVHNVIEEIRQVDRDQEEMHVLATNIYVKTAQGWRIVAHHASVAPGKPAIEQVSGATLH
ncbi:nuclear transport factor 2 family protein [soil metagenome]